MTARLKLDPHDEDIIQGRLPHAVSPFPVDDGLAAEWSSEGPVGVGSVLHSVTRLLGREMTIEAEVTQWDRPARWDMKGATGPMSYEVSNVFEPTDAGTQVTQYFTGEIGGFFSIAEGLAVRQLQKQVTADGQTLKKLLEAA